MAPLDGDEELERILDSSDCKKLFAWTGDEERAVREEERLRWNFDFETETPLPGRYQWVRTEPPSVRKSRDSPVRSRRSCDRPLDGPRRRSQRRNPHQQLSRHATNSPPDGSTCNTSIFGTVVK